MASFFPLGNYNASSHGRAPPLVSGNSLPIIAPLALAACLADERAMTSPVHVPMDRPPGPLSRFVRWLFVALFKALGWRVKGKIPDVPKFVIAGASHTSNWDFMVFLGVVEAIGIRPYYIGKHSLFRWPIKNFMLDMGGIPVRRGKRSDMVRQVAAQFDRHEEFALVIAIEGTRSPTREWRTGFYRIALAADVPIVCAGPDYKHKLGVIGPVITPTGDYERDMAPAFEFFKRLHPRHPAKALFPDGGGLIDDPCQLERLQKRDKEGA